MTRERSEVEAALDAGNLWAAMRNGAYWKVRRSGSTKTWKRDPARYQIPIKAGLKSCGYVTNTSNVTGQGGGGDFIISDVKP